MKIRNIRNIVLTAVTAMIALGCIEEKAEVKSNAFSFTVRVSEVAYNYARITVRHDGPEDVTWYGFLTDNVKANEATIFYDEYMKLIQSGKVTGLKRDIERNILIENLDEEKTYKYIAFGLKENGELYENSGMGSIEFKTTRNIYLLTETEDWNLERLGRDDEGMKELISVESKEGGRFGWNYVSKASIDAFDEEYPDGYELWDDDIYMATVNGIEMFVLEQISLIQYYMSNGYELTDLTYTNTAGNEPFTTDERLTSGDYYLVAYGFKGDGQHTQTYSVEEITIEEEVALPEYDKWLGSYTFTGDVETTDEDGDDVVEERTYNILIEKYDNNFMYKVHGWECGDDVEYDWEEDIMQLDKEKDEYLSFPAYYNAGRLEIKESPMTYITFDGAETLLLGIYGYAFQNEANAEIPVILDGTSMALAEPLDENNMTELIGQTGKYENQGQKVEWDYCKMGYIAWNEMTGAYQTVNPAMRFPISITKVEDDSSVLLPETLDNAPKTLFNTRKISTDFLRDDYSRPEKMKPEIFERAY